MQTPEEIVWEIYDLIEWGGQTDKAVELLHTYTNHLQSSNQTLLDEVNRLNGVIQQYEGE